MKRVAIIVMLALATVACRPTAERRPVSLREARAPGGALPGAIAFVRDAAVGQSRLVVTDLSSMVEEILPTRAGYVNSPSWSPHGNKIAYSLTTAKDGPHIWVADPDGRNAQQVTSGKFQEDYPTWSPDESELIFSSTRARAGWRLFRMKVTGGSARQVSFGGDDDVYPTWSHTGNKVAYSSRRDGRYQIRLMDLAHSTDVELTHAVGDSLMPAFSPSGAQIVFASTRLEQLWQIYVYTIADDVTRRVIGSDSLDRYPTFSPDGKYIALSANKIGIYPTDGSALPDGSLRWRITKKRAWAPSWRCSTC